MADINRKKLRAAVLLGSGFTQAQTAEELGISIRTLQRWVKEPDFQTTRQDVTSEVTNATVAATAEHLSNATVNTILSYEDRKTLIWKECEYLDIALECVLPRVREGDLRAIDRLVKISERRSKLLALDMPKVDIIEAILVCAQLGILNEQQTDTLVNKTANFFEGSGLIDGLDTESESFEED